MTTKYRLKINTAFLFKGAQMKEKLNAIEYNLGLLKLRIEKLRRIETNNYQVLLVTDKLIEKLYEFSDLMETLEVLIEDELL